MEYTQLGTSDLQISKISLGGMSLPQDEVISRRIVDRAIELGINFFDTADLYQKGWNEAFLGEAFEGQRDKVIIATKVGNQWRSDGSGWDWNPRKAYILEAVDQSLRRLRTDYIDLYQLHGGTIDDPLDEAIEAFEQLKQAGKVRYYGISSIRPNVIRTYIERSNITSIMTQYSLLDRRPEESTLSLLRENNIGVLVRGGLAKGLLVNKPARAYVGHSEEGVAMAQRTVQGLATAKRGAAHVALQYCLLEKAVSSVVVGSSSEGQLEENVGAWGAEWISEGERGKLAEQIPALLYEKHR